MNANSKSTSTRTLFQPATISGEGGLPLMEALVRGAMRSTGDSLLPGEVREGPLGALRPISLEGPVEYILDPAEADQMPSVDIQTLPPTLEYAEGYRPDVVVFARSIKPGVMVTNLPVHTLSADHVALCSNTAEVALVALSVSEGYSLKYLGDGSSRQRLTEVGQEFANQFLRQMVDEEKTVIHDVADVRHWLVRQTWWRRSTESAPGTEFA